MEAEIVVPLVVMVFADVAMNDTVPVDDHVVPDTSDIDPLTASVGVVPVANVTVPADAVTSRHASAPVIVTV